MEFQYSDQYDRSPIDDISKIDPNTSIDLPDSTLSMKASISRTSPQTYSNDQITNRDIKNMIGHIAKINQKIDRYKIDSAKKVDVSAINEYSKG